MAKFGVYQGDLCGHLLQAPGDLRDFWRLERFVGANDMFFFLL